MWDTPATLTCCHRRKKTSLGESRREWCIGSAARLSARLLARLFGAKSLAKSLTESLAKSPAESLGSNPMHDSRRDSFRDSFFLRGQLKSFKYFELNKIFTYSFNFSSVKRTPETTNRSWSRSSYIYGLIINNIYVRYKFFSLIHVLGTLWERIVQRLISRIIFFLLKTMEKKVSGGTTH